MVLLLLTLALVFIAGGHGLLRSGNGGNIIAASGFSVPNERWSGNWRTRNAEVTQSDFPATLYLPVVQDNQWEFTAARDDVNFPEALGLTAGSVISVMFFKLGAGLRADRLTNTTVEEVNNVCDSKGDVVRVTVRGHGGFLLASQTPP